LRGAADGHRSRVQTFIERIVADRSSVNYLNAQIGDMDEVAANA
jgi:hypothetical protein